MLGKSAGEDMSAVERHRSAEKHIPPTPLSSEIRIQHSIKRRFGRHTDRSGRQSGVLVGVVRRIHGQVLVQNSAKRIVKTECHGRIRLKRPPALEPVEIYPGNQRHLRLIVGLPVHN